jgi:putative solute:sodium symporter small subunit
MSIRQKIRWLTGALLTVWALASFGWVWFARDLDHKVGNWHINFWMGAQGSLLIFLLVTMVHAWVVNHLEKQAKAEEEPEQDRPI